MYKYTTLGLTVLSLFLLTYVFFQQSRLSTLTTQLESRQGLHEQLLEQVSLNTKQRLDFEKERLEFDEKIQEAKSKLVSQALVLEQARNDLDPDVEHIRESIRQELQTEMRSQSQETFSSVIARAIGPTISQQIIRQEVTTQFGQFLDELEADGQRKQRIQDLLTDIVTMQSEAGNQYSNGEIDIEQLSTIVGDDFLRDQLASVMTAEELEQFERYQEDSSSHLMRESHRLMIELTAPSLSNSGRELVLNSLANHTDLTSTEFGSPDEYESSFTKRLRALEQVRADLEQQLDSDELRVANNFLLYLQSDLEMSEAMFNEVISQQ